MPGEILCRNVKELIARATEALTTERSDESPYKDFFEEVSNLRGGLPDFEEMTEEQYNKWMDESYALIKQDAIKKNKQIDLEIKHPTTGEVKRWSFVPAGLEPHLDAINDGDITGNTKVNGKLTTWAKVKRELPTAKEAVVFATRTGVRAVKMTVREGRNLVNRGMTRVDHVTDAGAGGFGR